MCRSGANFMELCLCTFIWVLESKFMSPGSCNKFLVLLSISPHSHSDLKQCHFVYVQFKQTLDLRYEALKSRAYGHFVQSHTAISLSEWRWACKCGRVTVLLTSETDCSHWAVAYVTTHITVQCEYAMHTCGRSLLRKKRKLCLVLSCIDRNTYDDTIWTDLV